MMATHGEAEGDSYCDIVSLSQVEPSILIIFSSFHCQTLCMAAGQLGSEVALAARSDSSEVLLLQATTLQW